jgi:hypothetical protein
LNFLAESRPGTSATREFILCSGSEIATFAFGHLLSKEGERAEATSPKIGFGGAFFGVKDGDVLF